MCDLLLALWDLIIGCVQVHAPLGVTEVAVDGGWYAAAVIDFLRVVGQSSRYDGAWRRLSRLDRPPWPRRFGGLEVVQVHVEIAGFFDGDGGAQSKLGRSLAGW